MEENEALPGVPAAVLADATYSDCGQPFYLPVEADRLTQHQRMCGYCGGARLQGVSPGGAAQ